MEAASMPTIVDFPTIVQEALTAFGAMCAHRERMIDWVVDKLR
jgi:hypothetical protein